MIGRIVEVADDNRHLHMHRGFLVVENTKSRHETIGQIPLDDICAVIANAHGLSYTNNLLVALAERGAPFVLCSANHNAVGMLISTDANFEQAKRIEHQVAASKPLNKRLWADIVRAKLTQQFLVLQATGASGLAIKRLASQVKSGDSSNLEAQGARKYWGQLLGDDFRRDQTGGGVNSLLNYGYTVVRAATARAIVATGMHPSIGIHHSNDGNAMRLVDDLMEPFRPIIDAKVYLLAHKGIQDITPESKRELVMTLYEDVETEQGSTPVMVCIQKLATSIAQIYLGEKSKIDLPFQCIPQSIVAELSSVCVY